MIFQQFTGIKFFAQYTTILFNEIQPKSGKIMAVVISCFTIISVIPTILLNKKYGRRLVLMLGVFSQFIAFAILSVLAYYKVNIVFIAAVVLLNQFGFVSGCGSTLPLYVAEIIPSIAFGLTNTIENCSAVLLSKFLPKFLDNVGPTWIIIFFCVCSINLFTFVWAYCPEIKNKNRAEIHEAFQKM